MRPSGRFLTWAGLLLIAGATLVPIPQQAPASQLTPLWCLVCGGYGGVDVVNNVLLFIPAALGLRLSGFSSRTVVIIGALLSLSVESLQGTVIAGRDASLSDVLTNSAGSWLGALLGTYRARLLYPNPTQAVYLAGFGAAVWLGVQSGAAALLKPWAPTGPLAGAWSPSVAGRPAYEGQVISAVLSGEPVPGDSGWLSPEAAQKIRAGRFDLDVQLLSGKRRQKWSPIVAVLRDQGALLALEALDQDLAFQPPLRSAQLKLGRPSLRLPGALRAPPGTRVQVTAGQVGPSLRAEWTVTGTTHRAMQLLSPSLGWSLIAPFRYALGPEAGFITLLWIAAWLLLIAYWTAYVPGRPFQRWGVLLVLTVAGLGVLPALTGYPAAQWSEWMAALVGLACGAAGHYGAAYFEKRCDSHSINESS